MQPYDVDALRATIPLSAGLPPAPNLYGENGPRCPECSGLGHVFRPRVVFTDGMVPRLGATSRCACGGTGIDREWQRRQEHDRLYGRIAELESKYQSLLESITKHNGKMSRQHWMECIAWATTDAAVVGNNSSVEAVAFPNTTIPANYMQDGRALRIVAYGKLSVATATTPTMTFALRHGGVSGTVLATTEAMTNGSGVQNVAWSLEAMIQTRANGSSGSLLVMGNARINTNVNASPTQVAGVFGAAGAEAPAPLTVDLTADWALSVTSKWGTAHADNDSTGLMLYLESLN